MSTQRFDGLDRLSTQFPEQLNRLLHDRQWVATLELAPGNELEELISHLDSILEGLDSAGQPFRKCLHILQKICGSKQILPSTYEVSGQLSLDSIRTIAFGGFCDAYSGTLDQEKVCIKRLRISLTGDQALVKQSLCKEAVVWKHLDHPNIVPFRGVTFDPLQLVSEWIPGGDLKEHIIRGNTHPNLINLLIGVANGLGYLHSRNVIHGDLKGANILVDAAGNPRIGDFGLATIARDSNSLSSTGDHRGTTPRFTAPEILKDIARHSKESDIFAFGMVVIEVFTGSVPFRDCIVSTAMLNIMMGLRPERPTHPGFTDDLWTLTQQCWEEDPQKRPQIEPVIEQVSAYRVHHSIWKQPIDSHWCGISQANPPASPLPDLGEATLFFLFPPFPKAPAHFFGRESILEDLLSLVERSASFALYGARGMGKTAIALKLLHHRKIVSNFGIHRYFVRCDNSIDSLDDLLGRLSDVIGFPQPRNLAQLLSHLEASLPSILVLDGIDFIIDPLSSGAAEIATTIKELGLCPRVCLLSTSGMDPKIPGFRSMQVSNLSEEAARNTFYNYCSLQRSDEIDDVLAELDFHPLSIVLLASAVNEKEWTEPELLEAWDNGTVYILEASGRESLEDNIESILRTPTIQELGTAARETLEAIANHPDGVQEIHLLNLFPEIKELGRAVNALCKFSLMYREDGFIKMHSPFRLHFQYRLPATQGVEHALVRLDGVNRVKLFAIKSAVKKISNSAKRFLDLLLIPRTNQRNRARDRPTNT